MENKERSKDLFVLVQKDERLLDKPLKTKQLSYFQDAMLRFSKNKYNVIATIVLSTMILLSIFVPILTPTSLYDQTNSALKTLPPRVPLIEKLGILDGTKYFKDQSIDHSTIDPETGLGYPTENFSVEYIFLNTLTNREIVGSVPSVKYIGGTNELYVDSDKISFGFAAAVTEEETNEFNEISYTYSAYIFTDGFSIDVDIDEMQTDGVLKVYYSPEYIGSLLDSYDDLVLLATIDTVGVTTINPFDNIPVNSIGYIVFKHEMEELNTDGNSFISFNSVLFTKNDVLVDDLSGYYLARLPIFAINEDLENGRFVRKDAIMTVASFTYDSYGALFGDKRQTIGESEYLQILEDNPGMRESIILDPDNPNAWVFGDDYPLISVLNVESITLPGTSIVNTNYFVVKDGSYALGFDKVPYFIFGTDVVGKDLFTLIWLGLRTSLLLGFLSAIVNIFLGVIWGATSAYYGGQVDILMERFLDIWGSFPQITMIGIITVLIGPGFLALFIFMVYDGWIGAAKVTRFQFYRYKGREYVLAARVLGASDRRIIFKHILPNALGTIVTRVVLSIPSVIFLEVNLSYLGFGIGNGQRLVLGPIELTGTSIGVILNDGQQQIFSGNLWLIIFPTIIVSILMITFNMFGNALRDALNPQLRGSE
ncbi:MAG: ABC transporter permease [Firmicutes bacterium]|nr:ABC transporter permease [Bacillota bacterium]